MTMTAEQKAARLELIKAAAKRIAKEAYEEYLAEAA